MRSIRISAILLSGVFFCLANVGEAAPMVAAFTYQGRLTEGNQAADGLFDLAFKLYDANVGGHKLGIDVNISEVDIIDGYFTVELDFGGGVFDGNAVWLEAGFRPGEQSDPCAYVVLEPRQQITPTPYALYAALSGGVTVPLELSGSIVSGAIISATNTSGHALYGHVSAGSGVAYGVYGRCDSSEGIGVRGWASTGSGTTTGVYGVSSSTSGHGVYGLASASSGTNYGVYGETNSSGGYGGYFDGRGYFSGNVGIGTAFPPHKLDVVGDAAITGNLYAGSGSTVLFVDDTNDNVGVGTTNTNEKLTIEGALSLDEIEAPSATSGYGKLYVNSSDNRLYFMNDEGTEYDLTIAAGGDSDWTISEDDMYSGVSGKVGIGTTTPNEKLTVQGVLSLDETASPAPTFGYGKLYVKSSDSKLYFKSDSGAEYDLTVASTGDSDWTIAGINMYSAVTGKVGIGTASPAHKLHVVGDAKVTGNLQAGSGSAVLYVDDATNRVGVGTTSATEKLEVSGNTKVDGDLVVTGAYRGNIGSNNGAPFPRPAYDSGWQAVSAGGTITLTHGLGGNADNYVVDLQFKNGTERHNLYYGYDYTIGLFRGAAWWGLTTSQIKVTRLSNDSDAPEVRVRIWVYN